MTIEWWHAVIAASTLIGIGIGIGKVETDRRNFNGFINEIRNDIKEIFRRLPSKPLAETNPLSLTDKGRKMLSEIDGETWARNLSQTLIDKVSGMDEYQIQEFCFKFVQEKLELTNQQEAIIRKCAYQNASNKEETLKVLAVAVRDNILETVSLAG